uniref:tudor domain-containing protein 15 n=1 Tax=Solea senegalensis TaxID=28829 RepID=UPI001CD86DE7|nr:tudor domain-containing protein 15 [Solea senegalensis]
MIDLLSQDSGSLASSCTLWPVDLKLTHLDWNPEDTLIHFQGQYLTICELDYNILQEEVQNTPKTEVVVDIGEFCLVEDVTSAHWYRGRVQSRKDDVCDVFLIDHGNVLSVDIAHVSSCSKDLFILPPKIVCGFLANVLLLQSVSPSVFENYLSSLIGRNVTGYVQALLPHKVLLLEAPDINNDLVRHAFGRHVDTETFLLLVEMLTEVPLKQNIESVPDLLIEKPVGQEFCFKSTNLHRYKDILSFCRHRLSFGTQAKVRVTAAVNPRLFYCQMVSMKTDLSDMSKKLAAVCDNRAKDYRQKTQENVGLLCSVKSKDGKWYRGFVPYLPFNSQVTVLFIDYGFFESVKVDNVHRLPPDLYSKPIMAFPCSLSCLDDQDYAVKAQQLSFLKAGLLGRVLDMEICGFDEEQHLYTINLISAIENYVKEPESAQEFPNQDVESVFVSADLSLEGGGLYFDKVLGEALGKTVEEEEVQVDSVFVGYVEYVQNPNQFWIRTQKRNEEFEEMMRKMADHFGQVKLDEDVLKNPALGTLCCAVHEADMHFYRAVIIDSLEHGAEVLFIDFGNIEKVPHMLIKKIPKAFASKPPFAICCSLNVFPLDEVWTSVASDFFRHTVSHKALSVHVVRKRKNKFVVDLHEMGDDSKRSVTDFLISSEQIECWNSSSKNNTEMTEKTSEINGNTEENYEEEENTCKSEIKEAQAPVGFKALIINLGSEFAVRCTCINSPSDFWCLPQDKIPALDKLMDKVQQYYSTNTVPLQSGLSCCVAKSPVDGRWCRAFITEQQNSHAKVILIDYGFTIQVKEKELQEIMPEFVSLEGQAFRCCFSNLTEPTDVHHSGDWHLEVCKAMKQFVTDSGSVLRCRIVSQLNVKCKGLYNVVDLYNSQTQQTLTDWLVGQGLARGAAVSTMRLSTVSPESFVYSSYDLSPGHEEQVFVTHISSQWEVFCHLERNTDIIEELENRICEESEKMKQASTRAVVSKLCLAKYFDGNWYRGLAHPVHSPLHLNVFFVDYGNSNISEKTHVMFIPRDSTDLLYTPMQALRFCLTSVSKEELYADVKEWLSSSVLNKQIKAVISTKNEDGSFDVELFDGDVNINEKVKELILSLRPQQKTAVTFVTRTTTVKPKTLNRGNTRFRSQPRGRCSPSPTIKPCRSSQVRNAPQRKRCNTKYYVQNNTTMKQQLKNKSKNSEQRKYQDTNTKPEPQANKTDVPQLSCLPEKKLSAGLKAKCFVSHIDSVDCFYLHLSEDEPAILKMCEDLNSSSFRNSLKAATSLRINDLVLAEYEEDGALYRSIVKDYEGSLSLVEFVDYGNTAVVGKEKISPMTKQYLSQPRFSISCSLFDTSTFENDNTFTDAVMERPLVVEFVCQRGTLWEVNVEIVDGDVGVTAAPVQSSSVNEKDVKAPESSPNMEEEMTTCELEENKNEKETSESIASAAQGEINKPKTPTFTFLTKLKLETRRRKRTRCRFSIDTTRGRNRTDRLVALTIQAKDRENGTVLSVQDNGSFYIRLARTSYLLATLENHIANSLCKCLLMVKDVKPGYRCLVQVNTERKWHRAVVQHVSEEKCYVLLVDHGITEEIPRGSMRQQCGNLTKIPYLAVKCKVNVSLGITGAEEAEESTCDTIKSMIGQDVDVVFARYSEADDLWMVEVAINVFLIGQIKSLPLDEETVVLNAGTLKEATKEPNVDPILPQHLAFAPVDGDKGHFGFAASVTTPFEFCVILEDSLHNMNKASIMLDNLPEQTSPLPEAHIVRGTCCLLESDSKNKWCRAEIVHADATVLLHLVDYGHSECLPYKDCTKLKRLPEELLTLPKGTHPCVLRGVRPVGGAQQWTNEAAIFFQERLYQRNLQIFFREFVADSHWKVDVLSDGIHVAKELVEAGHATSTDAMLALRLQKRIHQREEEDDGKSHVSAELTEAGAERRSLSVLTGSTRCKETVTKHTQYAS